MGSSFARIVCYGEKAKAKKQQATGNTHLQRLAQVQVMEELVQLALQRGIRDACNLHRLAVVHAPQQLPNNKPHL